MKLGFLIDQDTCIGCHACTVACKSEHEVPISVNRTWLKYVETGQFPQTERRFSVMRCNHCEDAPCVDICPTSALFHRDNGIVDFDTSSCIGCKSCMNACPYDALYIDPEERTAQKCNFCAHRIDQQLEPSCVVVCPTQSIHFGDLDDPDEGISRLIAANDVAVRSPERGTRPKLYYKGADEACLDPTLSTIAGDGMIWAETTPDHKRIPLLDGGRGDPRTAYTTAHPAPWGWRVSSYLITKAIGSGAMLVAVLLVLLGRADERAAVGLMSPVVAGAFIAITGVLLVADLKQPKRALFILTRAQTRSWLTKGAAVLAGFAALTAAWFVLGLTDSDAAIEWLALPVAVLAAASAGYTAFLFAQCRGRELWQTRWLLPLLLAQALAAGAAVFAIADLFMSVPESTAVRWALLCGALAYLGFLMFEVRSGGSRHADLAMHSMTRGAYAPWFRVGVAATAVGAVLGGLALSDLGGASVLAATGGLVAVVGMGSSEHAFVRAGQSVPLS